MNRRESIKLLAAATGVVLSEGLPLQALSATRPQSSAAALPNFETKTDAYATAPAFTWLRFGAVKPGGWIKVQMLRDLHSGFAGCLDKLCVDAGSDVFATGRSAKRTVTTGVRPHPTWWFGETEGNWRAGWIMLACLSEDPGTMRKVDAYVQHVLASQAPDGYIGIFQEDLRYKTPGDLWTQACLFRGLLAYAECKQDAQVLHAIVRACDGILKAHAPGAIPLSWTQSHDLMIVDVLERLHDLTGDRRYLDFSMRCYQSWSAVAHTSKLQGDDDVSLPSLLDPGHDYYLGHSVHTVEHLRVPVWLAAATGKSDYVSAAGTAMSRTHPYSFTTGSIVGNGIGGYPGHRYREFIDNSAPDPYEGEWEYCTARETQVTFTSALQKTGNLAYADRVENVFLNAAQGGRLPDGKAITYMTPENRLCCNGRSQDGHESELRNTFSPTSEDVAICCNPNSTQVSSHFVRGMWMRHRDGGLAALLYGPSVVSTEVNGTPVTLDEQTNYPFDHVVTIVVHPERDTEFTLHLRNPAWSSQTKVSCNGATITRDGDFFQITRRWRSGDTVRIEFQATIQPVTASNNEIALQYGALFFALPIPSRSSVVKTYPVPGFHDSYFVPVTPDHASLAFRKNVSKALDFSPVRQQNADLSKPFDAPVFTLRGSMTDTSNGTSRVVHLVPFGNAVPLRQLTFPVETPNKSPEKL